MYKSTTDVDASSPAHFPDADSTSSLCKTFGVDQESHILLKTEDLLLKRILSHPFQDDLLQLLDKLKGSMDLV
jgi:hypothetical protein